MKALKALVVVMAVLIVAALTAVVFTLVQRAGDGAAVGAASSGRPGAPAPSVPIAGLPGPGFGETSVALPPGAEIVETRIGDGRIVLRIREPGGGAALVVIDAATGRRLGLVRIETGGAAGAAAPR